MSDLTIPLLLRQLGTVGISLAGILKKARVIFYG